MIIEKFSLNCGCCIKSHKSSYSNEDGIDEISFDPCKEHGKYSKLLWSRGLIE